MTPRIIGLTGQTGAGKSTVSQALREAGFAVIDCDRLAHWVTDSDPACISALAAAFSPKILTADGRLDRKALGAIVFSDPVALQTLNDTIFPFIRSRMMQEISRLAADGADRIILDAPTLFESGTDSLCERIVAVTADEDVRRKRIMKRDGISADAAQKRIDSQLSEKYFRAHADEILENNGSDGELAAAISRLISALQEGP